jgi:hypothetical protein
MTGPAHEPFIHITPSLGLDPYSITLKVFANFSPDLTAESGREFQPRPGTLKAFANCSPGFALKPWEPGHAKLEDATLKGLRRYTVPNPSQPLQGCESKNLLLFPRVSKQTLGCN